MPAPSRRTRDGVAATRTPCVCGRCICSGRPLFGRADVCFTEHQNDPLPKNRLSCASFARISVSKILRGLHCSRSGALSQTRLPGRSLANTKRKTRKPPLVACEPPEQRRSYIIKYVVRILMIRGVEGEDPHANLAAFGTIQERYVQRDVPVDLRVQGKVRREARTVRRAYVVLQNIQLRIREPRMDVSDRS